VLRAGHEAEEEEMTDGSITGAQALTARRLLGLSQMALATQVGTSKGVISHFERTGYVSPVLDLDRLRKVFEDAGIEFRPDGPPQLRVKRAT
jgi:transcriptional regulator with XRE-family HTH domain